MTDAPPRTGPRNEAPSPSRNNPRDRQHRGNPARATPRTGLRNETPAVQGAQSSVMY